LLMLPADHQAASNFNFAWVTAISFLG